MATDLEKSHSKWSNAKLTFKSVLLVIFFNLLWVILYFIPDFKDNSNSYILYLALVIDLLILVLLLLSFKNFKR